ncbi:MAG: ORF6N domain-containing protein [Oleiphilaceae bacterium]|nr:ORF6N domain-containing protein [Oleiphilaceae bacterium]
MSEPTPIPFAGTDTLSFRQIDEMNGLTKGTTFRLFKRCLDQLVEGEDYFYLPDETHGEMIGALKESGQIYQRTTHLVLITASGYARLQTQ